MGAEEIRQFVSWLASERQVSASTHTGTWRLLLHRQKDGGAQ
jgi:hypothetical protein